MVNGQRKKKEDKGLGNWIHDVNDLLYRPLQVEECKQQRLSEAEEGVLLLDLSRYQCL